MVNKDFDSRTKFVGFFPPYIRALVNRNTKEIYLNIPGVLFIAANDQLKVV